MMPLSMPAVLTASPHPAGVRTARIGHVLPWPAVGGTEHATLRIARAVQGDEFESVVFCLRGAEPVVSLFESAGLPWDTYQPPVHSYRRYPRFLAESRRLARQFRDAGVDIIHCADLAAGYHAALAGWLAKVPVLCHIRNRFDKVSRRDASFLWPVDRFVFVSQNTWDGFASRVTGARGRVLYDGIALETHSAAAAAEIGRSVRAEFGIAGDAPLLGTLARVAPQKDFPTLIKAASIVRQRHPRARFLVAGDHDSEATYREHYAAMRALIRDYAVEDAFVFTGYRTDVRRLMIALDIFVLSTHWEGLPLVLLEAMSCRKPVVATAVDGVPEAIVGGRTGLLFAHQDAEGLAAHLIRLIEDPSFASALSCAGYQDVRERFSLDAFAASLRSLYRDALVLRQPGAAAAVRR